MFEKFLLALTTCLVLPILASAEDFKRIKSKSDYLNTVADRTLVADWGWVKALRDGRLTGEVNGEAARGEWEWRRGFWCRTISYGSTTLSRNCQAIFVSGDTLVAIRDKGKGKQTAMKFR